MLNHLLCYPYIYGEGGGKSYGNSLIGSVFPERRTRIQYRLKVSGNSTARKNGNNAVHDSHREGIVIPIPSLGELIFIELVLPATILN